MAGGMCSTLTGRSQCADNRACAVPAATKAMTVGYGRHLLASAPAPATTKSITVGYGRHLLATAPAPGPGLTKAEFVPFGRRLLASAPAPASEPYAIQGAA